MQIDHASNEENCKNNAKKLAQILIAINGKGETQYQQMLQTFSHSASCTDVGCNSLCLMFRRVRRHIIGAQHHCYVFRLYSHILRRHVSSCNSDNCGLPGCPTLRLTLANRTGPL